MVFLSLSVGCYRDFERVPILCRGRNFFRSLASEGFPSVYSKSVCVRLHTERFEPTMLFSQTTPEKRPPTPPPSRWTTLVTLPHLAKFQVVWRRLCDVVLFASSFFDHTITAVCVQRVYLSGRKYICIRTLCEDLNVFDIFDKTYIVLKSGWGSPARMPRLVVSPPSLSLSPPDATANPMASYHHFTPPHQVSARLAPLE